MIRRIYITVAILTLIVLHSSCFTYREVEFMGIEGIQMNSNVQDLRIHFEIRVMNPNNKGIRLTSAHADFQLLDQPIGRAELQKSISIPANSEVLIPFNFYPEKNDLNKLIPVGLAIVLGQSKGRAGTQGSIKIRKYLWKRKVEFNLHREIDKEFLRSFKFN